MEMGGGWFFYSNSNIINLGAAPRNSTYVLYAVGSAPNFCFSNPVSKMLLFMISPEITSISGSTSPICSNGSTNLSVSIAGGASSVVWTSSSGYNYRRFE